MPSEEGVDQIPDKRYVPYIKRVLERWLLEARARAKGMTDKVDFYHKEYKTELSNLSGTPSSESLDTSSEIIQNPEQHPLDFPSLMEFRSIDHRYSDLDRSPEEKP